MRPTEARLGESAVARRRRQEFGSTAPYLSRYGSGIEALLTQQWHTVARRRRSEFGWGDGVGRLKSLKGAKEVSNARPLPSSIGNSTCPCSFRFPALSPYATTPGFVIRRLVVTAKAGLLRRRPILLSDRSLLENPSEQFDADVARVRIRNRQHKIASNHVRMFSSLIGAVKTQPSQSPDELPPRNGRQPTSQSEEPSRP